MGSVAHVLGTITNPSFGQVKRSSVETILIQPQLSDCVSIFGDTSSYSLIVLAAIVSIIVF
jgi:hypothetical protein